MKTDLRSKRRKAVHLALTLCAALAVPLSAARADEAARVLAKAAQGNGFSYQGELADGASLANGNYDLRFRLFTEAAAGSLTGSPDTLTFINQPVVGGLFDVVLDFGPDAFGGDERYLEVGVRPGGSAAAFTVLTPRQKVTAAPYALYALAAGRAQLRRFYLTTGSVAGNAATTACAAGYHMASLWELMAVGTLQYDTGLGVASNDSGSGPPASLVGWIRTGTATSTNTVPGNANCNAWTSNDPAHNGTRAGLQPVWATASEFTSPWDALVAACSTPQRVWCVQD